MVKFAEASTRLYKNVFVCKDCKTKFKAQQMKVIQGKISCRNCKSKSIRPIKTK